MTRPQYDALSPREKDALVAEHVMGWRVRKSKYGHWVVSVPGEDSSREDGYGLDQFDGMTGRNIERQWWDEIDDVPAYTSDISAAWKVVDKMLIAGADARMMSMLDGGWRTAFMTTQELHEAAADSAPESICAAALIARGVLTP
jgi:hypothetical protein